MSLLIDLDDMSSLEKLGQALCKIPSFVVSMTKSMMEIPESRKIILEHVKPVLKDELDTSFDARLATSELKPIKRIAELEFVTGLDDYFDPEEEYEPTIPEQIEALKEEIQHIGSRPQVSPQVEFKPETKTGIRAMHLITKLKASDKKHLTHKEIKNILTSDLPEDCKIDPNSKNPRKTIIDVLNEAVSLCSDVFLDQKKKGHREWRMILKS